MLSEKITDVIKADAERNTPIKDVQLAFSDTFDIKKLKIFHCMT